MEFGNKIRELEVIDAETGVIIGNPLEMVDRPFAGDIVWDNDIADGETFQYGCDDIIRVDIPAQRSVFPCSFGSDHTYRSPRCRSPTPFLCIRECLAHTQATTPEAM
jgi:hypothetical protein